MSSPTVETHGFLDDGFMMTCMDKPDPSFPGEILVSTLSCFLPAGTTTTHAPDWQTIDVARFQAQRLAEAGYYLVKAT